MRVLSTLALALFIALPSFAGPKEEAAAALAIAKAKQQRKAPEVTPIAKHRCFENLADAKAAANKEGKHLIVLVGMTCEDLPDMRAALADCVWCHQASYNGSAAQRLLVPTDVGSWSFPKSALDRKAYTAADVRAVLGRRISFAGSDCGPTG